MANYTKQTFRIYLEATWKYKFWATLLILSVIAAASIMVSVPLFFKRFFDILSSGQSNELIVSGLIQTLVFIALLEVASWVCWRIATFTASYVYALIMADLANRCFAYLHQHSFNFFNNNFVGSLVKKVKWFSRAFDAIADKFIWNLLPLAISITVIIFVLWQRSVWLAIMIGVWLMIFLVINTVFTYYKLKYDIKRSQAETETTAVLADTITNHSVVKLFGGYQRECRNFADVTEALRRLRRFTWDLDNIFEAVQGGLMIILEVAIFFLAIKLWQTGVLTVGDFVLIQVYIINIFSRVWDFGRTIRSIYENLADAEEMTAIFQTPNEIVDLPTATELKVTAGKIKFAGVDFYYHHTRPLLEQFNFEIKPQQHIALIGPSGAGKTTVVRLLLRMHDVSGGAILIDDQDISKVTQESLWHNISLVPQDPILFHRTLIENIRYGKPSATDKEVIAAAKAAHCHEFISGFEDGYNTYVGERGVKLSGGERQRIAIARAILCNAPILVLDEATSSLDSESESLIQDALDKLMIGKTVIVIAHRLSTIKKMNRIFVIDSGGILEEGSHGQLSKKQGSLYRRLWELQAGGFIQ